MTDLYKVVGFTIMYVDGSTYEVSKPTSSNVRSFHGGSSSIDPKELVYIRSSDDEECETGTEYKVKADDIASLLIKYATGKLEFIKLKPCAVARVELAKRYEPRKTWCGYDLAKEGCDFTELREEVKTTKEGYIESKYKLFDGSCSSDYMKDQKFEVVVDSDTFSDGSVVELYEDDESDSPLFKLISGDTDFDCCDGELGAYEWWNKLIPVENNN